MNLRTAILVAAVASALAGCNSTNSIAGYDAEIKRVQSELAEAQSQGMGADHPTVAALNQELETLESERSLKLRWANAPEAERGF